VAAQLGVNIGAAQNKQSVQFYAALLESRDLLVQAILTNYRFPEGDVAGDTVVANLIQAYDVTGQSENDRIARALRLLESRMSVVADQNTNIVTLRVRAPWPALAEAINRRLLDLVNQFNVSQLHSEAGAERRFLEERIGSARAQLDAVEDTLRKFLERNRDYQGSPQLLFEQQRLQANVDLRRQVYTSLAQSYEQARIAEVRDTPIITTIDNPEGSAIRYRHMVRNGLFGTAIGLLISVLLAFGLDSVRREQREFPEDYLEMERLAHGVWRRLVPRRLLPPTKSTAE